MRTKEDLKAEFTANLAKHLKREFEDVELNLATYGYFKTWNKAIADHFKNRDFVVKKYFLETRWIIKL